MLRQLIGNSECRLSVKSTMTAGVGFTTKILQNVKALDQTRCVKKDRNDVITVKSLLSLDTSRASAQLQ